jgi:putative restriction endonuclease
MKYYLGVTDNKWFNYLSKINPEDINFWQPSGTVSFKALTAGAPFLFKLKSPLNAIGGIGFFSSHTFLPISIAWDTFSNRNGCDTFDEFRNMITNYRKDQSNLNPKIGCIVLTNPIFFKKEDWIETPSNWGNSIVQGKSYFSDDEIGSSLWQKIETLLKKYLVESSSEGEKSQLILESSDSPAYGNSILRKVRLGQGAFRILIMDIYNKKCAITGEKKLPVLEAAHIKPYAQAGSHFTSNGILLRCDMHKLFDSGYLTITTDCKIEVSKRIREEFENGKEYYQYHGKNLVITPSRVLDRPNPQYIDWHNSNIYKG